MFVVKQSNFSKSPAKTDYYKIFVFQYDLTRIINAFRLECQLINKEIQIRNKSNTDKETKQYNANKKQSNTEKTKQYRREKWYNFNFANRRIIIMINFLKKLFDEYVEYYGNLYGKMYNNK